MKNKPGVMVYFEMRPVLDALTDEEAGQLFRAILEYGETLCEPHIPDRIVPLWPLLRSRIFFDDQRYRNMCEQNAYKPYHNGAKKRQETPLSFDEWILQGDEDTEEDLS